VQKLLHQFKNEDKDFGLLLLHQLVDEDAQDVSINDCLHAKCELGQVDEANVGIVANLCYRVIKQSGGYIDQVVRDKNNAAHLRVGHFEHCTGS